MEDGKRGAGSWYGRFVSDYTGSFSRLISGQNLDILLEIFMELEVGASQKRAIQTYRSRLSERGLARFEVLGRDTDRELIRSLARRLAEDGPDAARLRGAIQTIGGEEGSKGGILAALRRSPLVGAELNLSRSRESGRDIML